MSLVRFRPEAPSADLAHLVERHLAKVEVAGSSPVIRSKRKQRPHVASLLSNFLRPFVLSHIQSMQTRTATSWQSDSLLSHLNSNTAERVRLSRNISTNHNQSITIIFQNLLTFDKVDDIIYKVFEANPSKLLKSGCGAVGSALPWGGRGRKFKSCHSDHIECS